MTRTRHRIADTLSRRDRYDAIITVALGGWFVLLWLTAALLAG